MATKKSSKKKDALKQIGFVSETPEKAKGKVYENKEMSKAKPSPTKQGGLKDMGACNEATKPPYMNEHDTIVSRTTGRKHEISMGPHGSGLVPKNPFASLAQEGYLHEHPEKLGKEKLAEFDAETKGKKLPKYAKKGGAK